MLSSRSNAGRRIHCLNAGASVEEQEFETVSSLEEKLNEVLEAALSSEDDSIDDDDDESVKELAKLSLLYTRRDNLYLNRTYVDESAIAGRGLFALVDAQKGDLLTCYPGDALVIVPDDDDIDETQDDRRSKKRRRRRKKETSNGNDDDDWTIVWGEHVTMEQEEVEAELQDNLRAYTLHAGVSDNNVGIFALPSMDANPAYLGHFVNDGVTSIPMTSKALSSYMLESSDAANAVHQDILEGCHMVTLARRDIRAGEEIFVTYGPEYWMEQPDFGTEEELESGNESSDETADGDADGDMTPGRGFG